MQMHHEENVLRSSLIGFIKTNDWKDILKLCHDIY